MAVDSTVQFKRGKKNDLPYGLEGEPLYCTDTNELYIGQGKDLPPKLINANGTGGSGGGTDLGYINVLDLGIKPEANFDNTSLFNDAINKGIKNFYFPSGTYELNLILSTPYICIKGDGIGRTIFNPHVDKDVINLQYVDNPIHNCEVRDLEIKNTDFTNNNGLSINGNDKGVNAVNDNHYFKI